MAGGTDYENIDESLLRRLAGLSRGSQRWFKTALQTVRLMPAPNEPDDFEAGPSRPARPQPLQQPAPADLEDVITGRADLEEHLESYPELAEELEGLGDIIDMLRDLGSERRKRGEQILREEILGQPPKREEDEDEEEDELNGS